MPMDVFVSSREQELEPEREIAAETIRALGLRAVLFEEHLTPQPSEPHDVAMKAVSHADLFVLILWQQYSQAVVDEYKAARLHGKPILCLRKRLRAEYHESLSAEMSDFIAMVERSEHSTKQFRTLQEFKEYLRQGIVLALSSAATVLFQATGKKELFNAGTEIVERARRRVVLVAKTPIVLVGTRPYDQEPLEHERRQLEAFNALIVEAAGGGGRSFRCVATMQRMQNELAGEGPSLRALRNRVKHRIGDWYDKTLASTSRLHPLRWITAHLPLAMSYLVADDRFLIWLSDGSNESVWIQARNERMARALDAISVDGSTDQSLDEVHHLLKL